MCGIVGAVSSRNVSEILMEGLRRLEYRGYDSAGIALLNPNDSEIKRLRAKGKVAELANLLDQSELAGPVGISHTRWATHGLPTEDNAHPHCSNNDVAIVHNGIIENHDELRESLIKKGYHFSSQTDTEVIVHLIHLALQTEKDLRNAVSAAVKQLKGAYALGVISRHEPTHLIAIRSGSPLVIGVGTNENFIASDPQALVGTTQKFIYLEEGDLADISQEEIKVWNKKGEKATRQVHETKTTANHIDKGDYPHFMLKEIFEQPEAIMNTLQGHLGEDSILEASFGHNTLPVLQKIKCIRIVACGTSFHAAMVGKYWIESIAKIPCKVEIASEYRYRDVAVEDNTLFVTVSQSGETADSIAALRKAKEMGYAASLSICNVPESSLARESDLVFLTRAGVEIGVAATKTFTAQLVSMLLLTLVTAKIKNNLQDETKIVKQLKALPKLIEDCLKLDDDIKALAETFKDATSTIFLGRGTEFPIALEGALKLKEISYIHAEAYPGGELKHGPLALIDENMPVVVIAQSNHLANKLASNIEEVITRGGKVIIFADKDFPKIKNTTTVILPKSNETLAPIAYSIPMQLLSYYVALIKETDVDQPRNLAKSVTVE